ncbi:ABC transporter substrate-binding protein [Paenibacillus filicis]|uniref:ABC transporter substrate-binding protein n=1 Tax=Paenibacillus gyeongsangnamensis TaxID=3388067 RepID=A0ABT4Q2T4_9BACL|nr:ABC transporter substrate-binding protein [Paenibacillus filicis]MCZ8511015.1 ABC transporter substrate-binding protein [Paenibacillus filicis]
MKKWLTVLLAGTVAVTASACSSGTKDAAKDGGAAAPAASKGIATSIEGKQVEIEFWHAMTGAQEEALKKITDDFTKANPNIKVKLVTQGNYSDLQQKLTAAAKAGKSPTLAQTYEDWNTDFISNDLVTDLTPYINDAKYGWSKDELNDISKVFRDDNLWDGKYYSLPFNKSTNVLFYNKTLLDKAGLKVPTTWDEVKDAAKKLTQGKTLGMGFENSVGMDLQSFVLQAGGEFIDEKALKVKFNSPEGKRALDYIYGFIKDGTGRTAGEDKFMSDPFGRGDVAMYIGSSAGLSFVDKGVGGKFDWDVAVLPKDKKAAAVIQGTNVSVFTSGVSDEQKLAAWQYIKFLINKENTAYWAMKTGYLPVRTTANDSQEYKDFVAKNPKQGVAAKQLDAGFFYPRMAGSTTMKNDVMKEVDAVLHNQKTVEQGLADAEKAANAALEKGKAQK